jgi:hypothetical protein
MNVIMDIIHCLGFFKTRFGNWICFHHQVKRENESFYVVGPLRITFWKVDLFWLSGKRRKKGS